MNEISDANMGTDASAHALGTNPDQAVSQVLHDLRDVIRQVAPNPMRQARQMRLLAAHGMSQAEIARQLGTTEGLVSQRLALLRLAPAIQSMLDSGQITFAAARACCRLTMEEQLQLVTSGKPITTQSADECLLARPTESLNIYPSVSPAIVEAPAILLSRQQVEAALEGRDLRIQYQGRTVHLRLRYDDGPNSEETTPQGN